MEPNVPDKRKVIENFKKVSKHIGVDSIGWRYDPIFIGYDFDVNKHIECFEKMAKEIEEDEILPNDFARLIRQGSSK